jgi:hypothetical protein
MAQISLTKLMDRVSLNFDCRTEKEAEDLYYLLSSQLLDGKAIHLKMADDEQEVSP